VIRSAIVVGVNERSAVAEARRRATECAESLRLDANAVGRAALITTELATNLVKHTTGGSILFASDEDAPRSLTIIALDKGEGIANVGAAMRDGYSTAGSPGTGLGAVARSSSHHDIYSMPGKGTVVLCRVDDEQAPGNPALASARLSVAGICVAKPRETESGDAWISMRGRDATTIVVADGLGHGPAAATASLGVIRSVRERPDAELENMLQDAHSAIRSTRGAAVGIARVHESAGRLDFIGSGNIAGVIVEDEKTRRAVSQPGIVGHEMRKVQVFSYPWTAGSILLMHSDGIGTALSLAPYPGLAQRDPALIAAVLYRDFCRGTDDATVVVAKKS
jgi:anti-sigma regulatory factor (Ser/Thr protein kinase)